MRITTAMPTENVMFVCIVSAMMALITGKMQLTKTAFSI